MIVRRSGSRPSGRTPASPATASAQAPAALIRTGALMVRRFRSRRATRHRAVRSPRYAGRSGSRRPTARMVRAKSWSMASASSLRPVGIEEAGDRVFPAGAQRRNRRASRPRRPSRIESVNAAISRRSVVERRAASRWWRKEQGEAADRAGSARRRAGVEEMAAAMGGQRADDPALPMPKWQKATLRPEL